MKNKDRMALKRHAMPMVDMHTRTHDRIQEVAQGFTLEMAMDEARRCIDCAKPTCREGCPIHMNIPAFIKNIERGEILAADRVLKQYSSFSAICGRVCPQEKQCEGHCIHVKMKDAPVAIGPLERFVADYERQSVKKVTWDVAPANGIKVAIIGSGRALPLRARWPRRALSPTSSRPSISSAACSTTASRSIVCRTRSWTMSSTCSAPWA